MQITLDIPDDLAATILTGTDIGERTPEEAIAQYLKLYLIRSFSLVVVSDPNVEFVKQDEVVLEAATALEVEPEEVKDMRPHPALVERERNENADRAPVEPGPPEASPTRR